MRSLVLAAALASLTAHAEVSPIEKYRGMAADEIELRQENPDASEEEIARMLAEWRKEQAIAAEAERKAAANAPRPEDGLVSIEQVLRFVDPPEDSRPTRLSAPELFRSTESFLPAGNRLIELYLTQEDVDAITAGVTPPMRRQFQVQVPRALEGRRVSEGDLAELTDVLVKELAKRGDLVDDTEKMLAAGNAKFQSTTQTDVSASMQSMQFLGVHRREPWGTFFTMSMAGAIDTAQGREPFQTYGAGALMRVGGQLVYLYSYADKMLPDAKTLAQSSLDRWANAVHAADPVKPTEEDETTRLNRKSMIGSLLGMLTILAGAWAIRHVRNQ